MLEPVRKCLSLAFGLIALWAGASGAAYPEKPIKIVFPYAPGGGGDVLIRTIQPALEKRLGQPVVVEYRPGAAGNLGALEVTKSAPDGYTLLLGATNNFVINQFLYPNMGFDPLQTLQPVTMVVDTPYLITTSAAIPPRSYAEFASYAQANPGKLNYGSPGNATVPHLSALMLSDHLAARMVHVPYRGSQLGLQALATNDVQMFLASYGIIRSHLASGKIRALAVAAPARLQALPDVPTTSEVGIPAGMILGNWWALAAPKGTDAAIVNRLAQEIQAVTTDPEVRKRFVEQGAIAIANTPEESATRMRAEASQWKFIIDKSGAKVDN